ncbi:LOW QUALITY PROTEIN: uncharacterized protein LOC116770384 [Danaus plexippus]|uniref:LOW QUALITY PROTEIN: uncharacterized protein LOC116770384 n=1 Tax=Danaus plexippus TaxID=13037 RepID=UPI002AB0FDE1|nr:LOW QUALITY PROTEIN: uncharacterized protein LOC116770384 [Danaus plexippus]
MFETNISDILELVHHTNNIVLLTKAFYSLGLYLLSQENGCDQIIKCRYLYDKILLVLNCCLQTKVSVALDFISVLLSFGDDEGYSKKQTLQIYVRNMIRTSGCLAAMCNLFTSCMMQRAPLRSLCVSLSMCARWSQSLCAHLVPLCIVKCNQEYTEIYLLLQSLLKGNDRNIQLFHECSGMSLFTRESLQSPECLFLLSTITDNTSQENITMLNRSPQVFQIVETLLMTFGPQSIIGQWSSIILYSKRKAGINLGGYVANPRAKQKYGPETTNVLQDKPFTDNENDTRNLFRNVYKEIMTLQRESNINNKKHTNPYFKKSVQQKYNDINGNNFEAITKQFTKNNTNEYGAGTFSRPFEKNIPNSNKTIEMSFSFLRKANEDTFTNIRTFDDTRSNKLRSKNFLEQSGRNYIKTQPTRDMSQSNGTGNVGNNTILDFKPPFVSTPKQAKISNKIHSSSSLFIRTPLSINTKTTQVRDTKQEKCQQTKAKQDNIRQSQNKTMSAKFFNLINGSCTTLVKSFINIGNIFKGRSMTLVNTDNTDPSESEPSCSYSFTEYMRGRDIMEEIHEKYEGDAADISNIDCNTCNDTALLRQKLARDAALQGTVKRLKIGINLYGCDFKRISRKMWPRETYMTPSVLYNLYRKLLVK